MLIVWGSRVFKKVLGTAQLSTTCPRCGNAQPWEVMRVAKWFTLFWIPVFPFSIKYYVYCPVCGATDAPVKKQEAYAVLAGMNAPETLPEHAQ